jgi:hypothetical protein
MAARGGTLRGGQMELPSFRFNAAQHSGPARAGSERVFTPLSANATDHSQQLYEPLRFPSDEYYSSERTCAGGNANAPSAVRQRNGSGTLSAGRPTNRRPANRYPNR